MFKNIGANWVRNLVAIAVAFVLTPFLIHTLGMEGQGTWYLIIAMTGYLELLVLGVPMASVRYFAEYVAEGDLQKTNKAIGSCLGLYLLMGGVALLIGVGLYALFEMIYIDQKIPLVWRTDARLAFGVVMLYISAGFVWQLPYAIMAAHHDFVLRNLVAIGSLLLRLCLTLGVLSLKASIVFLALVQVTCIAFELLVSWIVIHRRYPGTMISLRNFDWGMVRKIFSFSLYVLLLNMGIRLAFQTDAMVIGAFIGVDKNPFYEVSNNFVVYLTEFFIAIAAVVMPMATKLKTQGQTEELKVVFLKWSKIAFSLTMMVCLYLIILGPRFVVAWMRDSSFEAPVGPVLLVLMLSCFVFLPARGVALPILMGLGKPKLPTLLFLLAGVANLIISIILAKPLHLLGVSLGTAVPNMLFAISILVLVCHELKVPVMAYVQYVFPKVVFSTLPILGLLFWFRYGLCVSSLPQLIASGVAMVFAYGVIWVFFVYRNDPYQDLLGYLKNMIHKLLYKRLETAG